MKAPRGARLALLATTSLFLSLIHTPILLSASAVGVSIGSAPCTSTVTTATGTDSAFANGYCYIAFTSGTNSWTPPAGINSADILVVAGGGAGGAGAWGGGGGAGGVVYWAGFVVNSSTAYATSVGAGGTSGSNSITDFSGNRSNNGSNSWFNSNSTDVAIGGGAGSSYGWGSGSQSYATGSNGGSGGGASEYNSGGLGGVAGSAIQTLPTGATLSYGNNGGSTPAANDASGAGGGGAGGVGANVTSVSVGGKGGDGINSFASWLNAFSTPYGVSGYIAGGGGGGTGGTAGAGGAGGGGAGVVAPTINGVAGTPNTGSGGGGASYNGTGGSGGMGGSGLIIIRFQPILNSTVAIALQSGLSTATYRTLSPITVTVTGTNGKIKLTEDGKVIMGCKALATTGLSATCNWKPDLHRRVKIVATFTPASGYTGSTSTPIYIQVNSRSNTR